MRERGMEGGAPKEAKEGRNPSESGERRVEGPDLAEVAAEMDRLERKHLHGTPLDARIEMAEISKRKQSEAAQRAGELRLEGGPRTPSRKEDAAKRKAREAKWVKKRAEDQDWIQTTRAEAEWYEIAVMELNSGNPVKVDEYLAKAEASATKELRGKSRALEAILKSLAQAELGNEETDVEYLQRERARIEPDVDSIKRRIAAIADKRRYASLMAEKVLLLSDQADATRK